MKYNPDGRGGSGAVIDPVRVAMAKIVEAIQAVDTGQREHVSTSLDRQVLETVIQVRLDFWVILSLRPPVHTEVPEKGSDQLARTLS